MKKISKRISGSVKSIVENKLGSEKSLKLKKEKTSIHSSSLRIPESSDTESKSRASTRQVNKEN
jgi:hypothetical protein